MRLIDAEKLEAAKLASHERVFVESWHSLTHTFSLDSYRVQCMNAHGIVRELLDELRIGRLNEAELKGLCEEALELLSNDPVVTKEFKSNLKVLEPLLNKPVTLPKKDEPSRGDEGRRLKQLQFMIEDLLVQLDTTYLHLLGDAVSDAISSRDEDNIADSTGILLTELVELGWPLESLFGWYNHFLTVRPDRVYSFDENFRFMRRELMRPPQEFEVTLRLFGSDKLAILGKSHGFRLASGAVPPNPDDIRASSDQINRFFSSHHLVAFAISIVDANDSLAAAITARNRVELLLDALRFEFEHRSIEIDDFCFIRRLSDRHVDLVRVRHLVPNPRRSVNEEDFDDLCKSIEAIDQKDRVSEVASQQLEVAMRQYRFGRDGESYRDKFLSWWLGIETLAGVGDGKSIGERVARNVTVVMMHDYMHGILRDLIGAIRYVKPAWTADLAGQAGCDGPDGLTVIGIVKLLQSPPHVAFLVGACTEHPILVKHVKMISECLTSPVKMLKHLKQHERRLRWHLNRIYRIRCCIVHGSPVRFRLPLFAAILEFYLREMIRFVLGKLRQNDHIEDLEELFQRSAIAYERLIGTLMDSSATTDTVREAVFMDVIVKGNPE